VRQSEDLRLRAQAVETFRDNFEVLVALMEPKATGFVMTEMVPRSSKEVEYKRQYRRVADAAGHAAEAAKGYEGTIVVDVPTRGRTTIQVIQSWQYALDSPWLVDPEFLAAEISGVAARLHAKSDALARSERTIAGKAARFVSFPSRVRAIVAEDHPSLGKAAYRTGVAVQIMVGALGGIIASGVGAGAVALWKLVT
jgi:hypothetical protein